MSSPSVSAPTIADAPTTSEGRRLRLFNLVLELRAFIALIVLIIVFALLSDSYLTWDNLVTMTRHVAINAILAIGMLMVILTGGIDLSVGSIVGLAGGGGGGPVLGPHIGVFWGGVVPPPWAGGGVVLSGGAAGG